MPAPMQAGSLVAAGIGFRSESNVPAESATASRSPPPFGPAANEDRQASLDCLAKAIGYEAGNEPAAGQAAVAQVILNRVRHRAFPKTVCNVVYQGSGRRTGCQFTFTCDGSLRRTLSRRSRASAQSIAAAALDGLLPDTVGGATHYHADYVEPRWAPSLHRIGQIGAHIFYRLPGSDRSIDARTPVFRADRHQPTVPNTHFRVWGLAPAAIGNGAINPLPGPD
jgi:spore germination cell wall hydrolase CwlJ-like protein